VINQPVAVPMSHALAGDDVADVHAGEARGHDRRGQLKRDADVRTNVCGETSQIGIGIDARTEVDVGWIRKCPLQFANRRIRHENA